MALYALSAVEKEREMSGNDGGKTGEVRDILGDEPAFSMGMGIRALTIIPEQRWRPNDCRSRWRFAGCCPAPLTPIFVKKKGKRKSRLSPFSRTLFRWRMFAELAERYGCSFLCGFCFSERSLRISGFCLCELCRTLLRSGGLSICRFSCRWHCRCRGFRRGGKCLFRTGRGGSRVQVSCGRVLLFW